MPYVTLMRFDGDPDDPLERKQRHIDPVTARVAPTAGGLAHITARTPDGLLLINVLADAEGGDRVGLHPDVEQALRESGMPRPTSERYEVARFVVAPNAPTSGA